MKTVYLLDREDLAAIQRGEPFTIQLGHTTVTMLYELRRRANGAPSTASVEHYVAPQRRDGDPMRTDGSLDVKPKKREPKYHRENYSEALKQRVVAAYKRGGVTGNEMAQRFGVKNRSLIYKWVKDAGGRRG